MSDYYWLSDKELKEMYGLSLNAIITSRDSYRIFSWKEPLWPCKDNKESLRKSIKIGAVASEFYNSFLEMFELEAILRNKGIDNSQRIVSLLLRIFTD